MSTRSVVEHLYCHYISFTTSAYRQYFCCEVIYPCAAGWSSSSIDQQSPPVGQSSKIYRIQLEWKPFVHVARLLVSRASDGLGIEIQFHSPLCCLDEFSIVVCSHRNPMSPTTSYRIVSLDQCRNDLSR